MGVFKGYPVVEIASTFGTMHSGRLLAEAGLPVLRLELGRGDGLAPLSPGGPDGLPLAEASANLKKRVLRVDPGRHQALIRRLAAEAAVLLTDRPECVDLAARTVTCHVHPYAGTVGGVHELPSADVLVQAATGAAGMTGRVGGSPVPIGFPIGDLAPGIFAAIGTLRGLLDDRPQRISVRAVDATVALLAYLGCSFFVDGEDPGFIGSGHPYIVPYGAYTAKDGFFIVAAFNQMFWRRLCSLIGRADLADNPRYRRFTDRRENRDELNALLNGIFRTRTIAEWVQALHEADIPNAPVFSMQQALAHDVVRARGMVSTVDGIPLFESPIMHLSERLAGRSGKTPLERDWGAVLAGFRTSPRELRELGVALPEDVR